MSSREKDSADFDLEKFVDLFDTAMSSDNPTIQRALRNLLMIAAMVDAENSNEPVRTGPLRRLVEDIKNLNQRISNMESKQSWAPPAYPYNPGPGGAPLQTPAIGTWPNTYPYPYTTTTTTGFPPNTIVNGGSATSVNMPIGGQGSGTTTVSYPGMSSTAYDDQFKVDTNDTWKFDKGTKYASMLNHLETK